MIIKDIEPILLHTCFSAFCRIIYFKILIMGHPFRTSFI